MSLIYVTIDEKTKLKNLYEENFFCSNCHKLTFQKLFLVKKSLKIYGIIPLGRLENTKILQCQECGVEKELAIKNSFLNDKHFLKNKIKELLETKNYDFYSKNLKECKNCGNIVGDIYEISKSTNTLKCNYCGQNVSHLIAEALEVKKKHRKKVILVLIIIGILLLLF